MFEIKKLEDNKPRCETCEAVNNLLVVKTTFREYILCEDAMNHMVKVYVEKNKA